MVSKENNPLFLWGKSRKIRPYGCIDLSHLRTQMDSYILILISLINVKNTILMSTFFLYTYDNPFHLSHQHSPYAHYIDLPLVNISCLSDM